MQGYKESLLKQLVDIFKSIGFSMEIIEFNPYEAGNKAKRERERCRKEPRFDNNTYEGLLRLSFPHRYASDKELPAGSSEKVIPIYKHDFESSKD